ncbi:MAG: hypothetical protein HPY58_08825 [Firmicutes bacterium]|nr:hypothetical protein [Bacillota bacterium]
MGIPSSPGFAPARPPLPGAGIGLTARCAEMGGADLIGIYSTAHWIW